MNIKINGDGADVKGRILSNDSTMANTLHSSQSMRHFDYCCGIHGATRARRGAKKATSAARRRNDRLIIAQQLSENDD